MNHELKILSVHFERVKMGSKTFEIRNNDRFYQRGDMVTLLEFNPAFLEHNATYTGASITFYIGDVYPIDSERVVFSLLPITAIDPCGGTIEE